MNTLYIYAKCVSKTHSVLTTWSVCAQSYLTICNLMDCNPPGSSVQVKYESHSVISDSLWLHGLYSPWNSPDRILEWIAFPFSRHLSNPGIEPRSPALHVKSLPSEPQGKPKNTGMVSLSLLQGINPGIELLSPALQADSLQTELSGKPSSVQEQWLI